MKRAATAILAFFLFLSFGVGCGGVTKKDPPKTGNGGKPGETQKDDPRKTGLLPKVIGKSAVSHVKFNYQTEQANGLLLIRTIVDPSGGKFEPAMITAKFRLFSVAKAEAEKLKDLVDAPTAIETALEVGKPLELKEIASSPEAKEATMALLLSDDKGGKMTINLKAQVGAIFDGAPLPGANLNPFAKSIDISVINEAPTDILQEYRFDGKMILPGFAYLASDKEVEALSSDLVKVEFKVNKKAPGPVGEKTFVWVAKDASLDPKTACFPIAYTENGSTEMHGMINDVLSPDSTPLAKELAGIPDSKYAGYLGCRTIDVEGKVKIGPKGDIPLFTVFETLTKIVGTIEVSGGEEPKKEEGKNGKK